MRINHPSAPQVAVSLPRPRGQRRQREDASGVMSEPDFTERRGRGAGSPGAVHLVVPNQRGFIGGSCTRCFAVRRVAGAGVGSGVAVRRAASLTRACTRSPVRSFKRDRTRDGQGSEARCPPDELRGLHAVQDGVDFIVAAAAEHWAARRALAQRRAEVLRDAIHPAAARGDPRRKDHPERMHLAGAARHGRQGLRTWAGRDRGHRAARAGPEEITDALARRTGFSNAADLLSVAKHLPGWRVFQVAFRYRKPVRPRARRAK